MPIDSALHYNRESVDILLSAIDDASSHWTTPRAPKKWSPAQVAEHTRRAYREAAFEVLQQPSKNPSLPVIAQPIARIFFRRVLNGKGFPKGAKTVAALDPETGASSSVEAREGILEAVEQFETAVRAAGTRFKSLTFGNIEVSDFVRFQAEHTRHHSAQIRAAGGS